MKDSLTLEQLPEAVIYPTGSKKYTHEFFIPHVGDRKISPPYTMKKVFKMIYESAFETGERSGEEKKS